MTLRGLCWDHERCVRPMRAAAELWERRTGTRVEWVARPLAAFNDQPLSDAVRGFDLAFVDHPHVGQAAEAGVLAPLDDLLDAGTLDALAAGALGVSHRSYSYAGRQWALATDAACHVSAARPDLLGRPLPRSWPEALALARERRAATALPLYPSDAICALLTLCASLGTPPEPGVRGISARAVELLCALADAAAAGGLDDNPPSVLDRMHDGNEIAYVPLTFGYVTYAPRIQFGPIPGVGGGILGGAGLAVPAESENAPAAAELAAWVSGAEAQRDVAAAAGGQPAQRAAFASAAPGSFLARTRAGLEQAWLRPRDPWWPGFQREAGELLHGDLRASRDPSTIAARLDVLLRNHRSPAPDPEEALP